MIKADSVPVCAGVGVYTVDTTVCILMLPLKIISILHESIVIMHNHYTVCLWRTCVALASYIVTYTMQFALFQVAIHLDFYI